MAVPAVHHHWLVLSSPFGPYESHKVQEISGVVGNAVVGPSHVLNLSDFPLLLALKTHTQKIKIISGRAVLDSGDADTDLWSVKMFEMCRIPDRQ